MRKLLVALAVFSAVAYVAPGFAAAPLQVYSVTDGNIITPRGDYYYGYRFLAVTARDPLDEYARVYDNINNAQHTDFTLYTALSVIIDPLMEMPEVEAGDRIQWTYLTESGGGELTADVWLPAATEYTRLYVGSDGATYTNAALTTLAQAAGETPTPVSPTPSATPSGAPTATPTCSPSPTPSVTPTPSPTPSVTPSPSTTPTPSPTPSVTPTPSTTPTVTPTPSTTPTVTPTVTPTPSVTPTPEPGTDTIENTLPGTFTFIHGVFIRFTTPSPTPTPSATPTPSTTPTAVPTPSVTPSPA